jgi:hypothetical protein
LGNSKKRSQKSQEGFMRKITLFILTLSVLLSFYCTRKITEPQYPKKVFISISGKVILQPEGVGIDTPIDFPDDYSNTQVNIYSVSMFDKDTLKEFTAITDSLGNYSAQFELKVGRRIFIRPQKEEYMAWPPYPNEIWLAIAQNSTGYPLPKGGYFNVLSDTMANFQVFGDTVKFNVSEWKLDDYYIHFGLLKGNCYVIKNLDHYEWPCYEWLPLSKWPYPESTAYISISNGEFGTYATATTNSLGQYKLWLFPGKNKIRIATPFTYSSDVVSAVLDSQFEFPLPLDTVFSFNVDPGYWWNLDFGIVSWFWLDSAWVSLKDSIIAGLTDEQIINLADSLAKTWGCKLVEVKNPYPFHLFKLDLPEGVGTKEMIEILKSKPEVKGVEPDWYEIFDCGDFPTKPRVGRD